MARPLEVNDKVKYAAKFLKSIGCGPTESMWRETGTVVSIGKSIDRARKNSPRLIKVVWDWDKGLEHRGILECNLTRIGALEICD